MSKSFESNLRQHLESKSRLTAQDRRLLRILDLPPTNARRKRVLGRLEDGARTQLQADGQMAIDWGAIDWAALLETLAKFIKVILDLFA